MRPLLWILGSKDCEVKILHKDATNPVKKGWFTTSIWYESFLVSMTIGILYKKEKLKALKYSVESINLHFVKLTDGMFDYNKPILKARPAKLILIREGSDV